MPMSFVRLAALAALVVFLPVSIAQSKQALPDCEELAAQAGAAAGLPDGLLPAIARVESGKTHEGEFKAWPWTLNQGGAGSYHANLSEALDRLEGILRTGEQNVDLGCMQLNWRWHNSAFADAAAMMEPSENTRYAAGFLAELHKRHGNWTTAVAHYHSADPVRGNAYAAKVADALGKIDVPALSVSGHAKSSRDLECPRPSDAAPKSLWDNTCVKTQGLLILSRHPLIAGSKAVDIRGLTSVSGTGRAAFDDATASN